MALMPLAFETRSETTRPSYTRSPMSPGSSMDPRMPSSRGNTSPHYFGTGHAVQSPRDHLSPNPHEQASSRGIYQEAQSANVHSGHMTRTSFHNAAPKCRRSPRKSKASSHSRRRSADSSLIAVGAWSSQSHHRDGRHTRIDHIGRLVSMSDDVAAKNLPMDYNMMDDFVLFPEDTAENTTEDAMVPYDEAPAPPRAPRISRLRTPDLAPMSTDVQFFPCLGDEREEDRINETWYLAGRDRVDSQLNDALAYMTSADGRRRMLRN